MLVYGTLDTAPLVFSGRQLMTVGGTVEGFWLSNYLRDLSTAKRLKLVSRIGKLIQEGILESEVGESFPLDEVCTAVQVAERAGRTGKVLLRISDPEPADDDSQIDDDSHDDGSPAGETPDDETPNTNS